MDALPLALACGAAACMATLAVAAYATPRAWWRRPNARALLVLVAGTASIGSALWWLAPHPDMAPDAEAGEASPHAGGLPERGRSYRVAAPLNLRAAGGTWSSRVAVLPAGTRVKATGSHDGDWWQVAAEVDGLQVAGWTSSLWLRRADEGSARQGQAGVKRIGLK